MNRADHLAQLLRLLDLEAQAEAEQLAARRAAGSRSSKEAGSSQQSDVLQGLVIREEDLALGDRLLLVLTPRRDNARLPWHRLRTGAPVVLLEEPASSGRGQAAPSEPVRGVVSGGDEYSLRVVVPFVPESEQSRPTWRVELVADEISRQRQKSALLMVQQARHGRLQQLRQTLLGERPARFREQPPIIPLQPQLNASQKAAVEHALSAEDVAIVHGPPGTGKTVTVVEIIRQAIARGQRVLACSGSHLAVDNVVERLVAQNVRLVRLGHPARVSPALVSHTLDHQVAEHPDLKLARNLLREAGKLKNQAARFTRAKPLPGAKQELRREARELQADARRIERQAVQSLLSNAEVVCGTLTGLDGDLLGDLRFDLCVIDEASQTTEPQCWIPLVRSECLVLAGDHQQLPPVVVSQAASQQGLACSLMERLLADQGTELSRLLSVQYRMHRTLMEFPSREFYDGKLIADPSAADRTLADLAPGMDDFAAIPLEFVDTAGGGCEEEELPSGSRRNVGEGELVVKLVAQLRAAGLTTDQIAVITPYSAQAQWLRDALAQAELGLIEVDTVDGFQGREKEAVVISLVRGNATGELGFLNDLRRMNVALTRSRRKTILVGDSATLGGNPFYRRLLEQIEQHGRYSSVFEW